MNGGWSAIVSLTCTAHPVAQLLEDGVNDAIRDISERTKADHLSQSGIQIISCTFGERYGWIRHD